MARNETSIIKENLIFIFMNFVVLANLKIFINNKESLRLKNQYFQNLLIFLLLKLFFFFAIAFQQLVRVSNLNFSSPFQSAPEKMFNQIR